MDKALDDISTVDITKSSPNEDKKRLARQQRFQKDDDKEEAQKSPATPHRIAHPGACRC